MNRTLLSFCLAAGFIVSPARAQDLVPATSEDLREFDRQISRIKPAPASGQPKDHAKANFGSVVQDEARKLKNGSREQREDFGTWVSSQRRKSDENRPSAAGSNGGARSDRSHGSPDRPENPGNSGKGRGGRNK